MVSNFKHILLILLIAQSPRAYAEVLWDNWYTITDHGHPDSYYNEKAELVGDRAKIQVNRWIKSGQKIRSEALGAVAKNTDLLEPLLYDFRTQTDTGEEKVIDGSILDNGKVFSVKVKTGSHTSKPLRAQMIPKLILSSFFPLWVHKNYKRITGVQPIEFQAIVEDQVDTDVKVIKGTAYEMREDDISKATHTRKIRVEFFQTVAIWYISAKGDALKIILKQAEQVVEKTDRKTAEDFLKTP